MSTTDLCESCGLPKRTIAQCNGLEPCGNSCPTWLVAGVSEKVKVSGCAIEAYRKLVTALARIAELEQERDEAIANEAIAWANDHPKTNTQLIRELRNQLAFHESIEEPVIKERKTWVPSPGEKVRRVYDGLVVTTLCYTPTGYVRYERPDGSSGSDHIRCVEPAPVGKCPRCGVDYLDGRVCSGSNFTLACVEPVPGEKATDAESPPPPPESTPPARLR